MVGTQTSYFTGLCLVIIISVQTIGLTRDRKDTLEVRQITAKARQMLNKNADSLKYLVELGLGIANEIYDQVGVAELTNTLGMYFWVKGDFENALANYSAALEQFQNLRKEKGVANCLLNMGLVYLNLGDNEKATELLISAQQLAESIKFEEVVASAANSLGVVNKDMGDFNSALEFYQKAVIAFSTIGNTVNVAGVHTNIGKVHFLKGEYRLAFDHYQKALYIFDSLHISRGLATTYIQLAELLKKDKDFHNALEYSNKALRMSIEFGFKEYEIESTATIAEILFYQGKYEKSIATYKDVILQAKKYKYFKQLVNLYRGISECYSATNDYKNSLIHYEKYSLIKDSLYNQQNQRAISNLNIRYKLGRKELEEKFENEKQRRINYLIGGVGLVFILVSILFNRNLSIKNRAEQFKLRDELQRQLFDTKITALQAQLNPHFIFNCLNSINYFILEEKAAEASDYLAKFSKLIRLFMDEVSSNYTSIIKEHAVISLYLELEKLRYGEKLSYSIEMDANIDSGDNTLIPSMIVQPFIENALVHGIQPLSGRTGLISVRFSKIDSGITCVVEDNGVGRNSQKSNETFKKKSYGLNLSRQRLKILQSAGEILIEDLFDQEGVPIGTRVSIYFISGSGD